MPAAPCRSWSSASVRHPLLEPKAKATVPEGTLAELTRFYTTPHRPRQGRDVALFGDHPPSQIVFGTDFPYRTGIDHVKG